MKVLCFVSCFLFVGLSSATFYNKCESAEGEITSLSVSNCDSGDNCKLKVGTTVNIAIDFNSKTKADKITIKIFGVIGGVPMPFPGQKTDACDDTGITCPIENGKSYKHTNSFEVKSFFPRIKVLVRYILEDANENKIICAEIPSEIVD